MGDVGEAYDEARAAISEEAADILPDVCSFSRPESATGVAYDAYGESTTESQSGAASVPCEYMPLNAYERAIGGQMVAGATHKIKVPVNSDTMAISADQQLVVASRGTIPALTFQVTGLLPSSSGIFLELAATLRS